MFVNELCFHGLKKLESEVKVVFRLSAAAVSAGEKYDGGFFVLLFGLGWYIREGLSAGAALTPGIILRKFKKLETGLGPVAGVEAEGEGDENPPV